MLESQPRTEEIAKFSNGVTIMNDEKTSLINVDLDELQDEKHKSCIVIEGDQIGKVFHFAKKINSIGRTEDADIRLDSTTVSRRHAEIRLDRGDKILIKDLGSSNGTYVNGKRIAETEMHEGDIFTIGTYKLKVASLSKLDTIFFRRIVESAEKDSLTCIYNKGSIIKILNIMLEQSLHNKKPLSVAMIDIDHFKRVNDTYGHVAGDAVLKHVAGLLTGHLRSIDRSGRFGGEEFIIIFDNTPISDAKKICERIRKIVTHHPAAFEDQNIGVTISIGIASNEARHADNADSLIKLADERLYTAKKKGRDQIVY